MYALGGSDKSRNGMEGGMEPGMESWNQAIEYLHSLLHTALRSLLVCDLNAVCNNECKYSIAWLHDSIPGSIPFHSCFYHLSFASLDLQFGY